MPETKIINPLFISDNELPLIVFVDDRQSWLSWKIKNHTKGNYNHVMIMHRSGFYASQNPGGYKEVKVEDYNKDKFLLKFWSIKLTDEQKSKMVDIINKELKKKTKYDYLAILGQLLRIPSLQNPWKEFCSENVIKILSDATGKQLCAPKMNPVQLNTWLHTVPELAVEFGYYFQD